MKNLILIVLVILMAIVIGACSSSSTTDGNGTDIDVTDDTDTTVIVPSAPTNVLSAAGDEQVVLTWDSVVEATSYNLYWDTNSGVSKASGVKISDASSPYIHSGLTNDTTYYYVVTAVNDNGESVESEEVSAMPIAPAPVPNPPSAPTNVLSAAGDEQVVLTWDSVVEATSYNLYWDTNSGVSKASGVKISDASSPYIHSGLTNDTTYYYVVTAVNDNGESVESEEVSAMPIAPVVPAEFWIKVFEGNFRLDTIQLTDDGGYISAGGNWIIKITENVEIPWQKTYTRSVWDTITASSSDMFSIIQKISNGYILAKNYIVLGSGGPISPWILELDLGGNIVWEKAYIDPNGKDIKLTSKNIIVTDNGYIIPCRVEGFGQKVLILEIDTQGEIIWGKTYQASAGDYIQYIQEVSSGGYIAAGYTWIESDSDYDLWVLRLDNQFDIIWAKRYGGAEWDFGYSIQETEDGFLVNAGTASFGAGGYDAWILELNAEGDILWQKAYGGPLDDHLYLTEQTVNEYVLAGITESFGAGDEDGWIVVLNKSDGISWQKTYGGVVNDEFSDVKFSNLDEILVVGYTSSFGGSWVLKLDGQGNTDEACDLVSDSEAVVTDTSVTGIDTPVTVEDYDVNIVTADESVNNTNAIVVQVCP